MVNKEYDPLEMTAFGACGHAGQMPAELDIPPPAERIPHNALLRPEERHEAIDALRVTERRHFQAAAMLNPATLDLRQEFDPLLVLERYRYPFFKSAGAMRR